MDQPAFPPDSGRSPWVARQRLPRRSLSLPQSRRENKQGGRKNYRRPAQSSFHHFTISEHYRLRQLLAGYFLTSPIYTVYGASDTPVSDCVAPAFVVVSSVLACFALKPCGARSKLTVCALSDIFSTTSTASFL